MNFMQHEGFVQRGGVVQRLLLHKAVRINADADKIQTILLLHNLREKFFKSFVVIVGENTNHTQMRRRQIGFEAAGGV